MRGPASRTATAALACRGQTLAKGGPPRLVSLWVVSRQRLPGLDDWKPRPTGAQAHITMDSAWGVMPITRELVEKDSQFYSRVSAGEVTRRRAHTRARGP